MEETELEGQSIHDKVDGLDFSENPLFKATQTKKKEDKL